MTRSVYNLPSLFNSASCILHLASNLECTCLIVSRLFTSARWDGRIKDWLGSFYPHDADSKDYLGYYAQIFDSLEIDSTFYHIPRPEVVTTWHSKTPDDFRFTAKLPKVITHDRGLVDVDDILTPFLSSMALLGVKIACYRM